MGRNVVTPPLPNVVLAGAPRCGTTSLFRWLGDHPQVGVSNVKETFYLMDPGATVPDRGRYTRDGLDGYRAFFAALEPAPPVVLEGTPGYLYQRTAREVLARELPEARLLFLLRRPADRLLSTYRYFSNNWTDLDARAVSFEDYVALTRRADASLSVNDFLRYGWEHGRYLEWLVPWARDCGEERMKVLVLERVRAEPRRALRGIAAWLGIDPAFYDGYRFPRENEAYRVRLRWLQSLNRRARAMLPEGGLRRRMRALYRRLNTEAPRGPDERERRVLERLDVAYAEDDRELARRFDLDLDTWSAPR